MATPLTWRDVAAPNFSGVASTLSASNEMFNRAGASAIAALQGFQNSQADAAATAAMAAQAGINPANLNAAGVKSILDAQAVQALTNQRVQETGIAGVAARRLAADNAALDAFRPVQAQIEQAALQGDTAAGRNILAANQDLMARLPVEQQMKIASGLSATSNSAVTGQTGAFNLGQSREKAADDAAAAALINTVQRGANNPRDQVQLLESAAAGPNPPSPVAFNAAVKALGLDGLGMATAASGSGAGVGVPTPVVPPGKAGAAKNAKPGTVLPGSDVVATGSKVDTSALNKATNITQAYNALPEDDRAYMAETDRLLGMPPGTTAAQLYQESKFASNATSNKGARGPAQVIDSTRAELEKRWGRKIDPNNMKDALQMHREVMQENIKRFGNVDDGMRAYNGGWTPSTWGNAETSAYVPSIAAQRDALAAGTVAQAAAPAQGLSNSDQRLQSQLNVNSLDRTVSRNQQEATNARLLQLRNTVSDPVDVVSSLREKGSPFADVSSDYVGGLLAEIMERTGENAAVSGQLMRDHYVGNTSPSIGKMLANFIPGRSEAGRVLNLDKLDAAVANMVSGATDVQVAQNEVIKRDSAALAKLQTTFDERAAEYKAAVNNAEVRPGTAGLVAGYKKRMDDAQKALITANQEAQERAKGFNKNSEVATTAAVSSRLPEARLALNDAQAALDSYQLKNEGKAVQGDREYLVRAAAVTRARKALQSIMVDERARR